VRAQEQLAITSATVIDGRIGRATSGDRDDVWSPFDDKVVGATQKCTGIDTHKPEE